MFLPSSVLARWSRVVGGVAIALVTLLTASVKANPVPIIVYGESGLERVDATEERLARYREWQIWLYERGKTRGNPSERWGLIVGPTRDDVLEQLKRLQEFEVASEKFFNQAEGSTRLTAFNPLGPIALIARKKTPKSVVEVLTRLRAAQVNVRRIMQLTSKTGSSHGATNRYAGIGTVLLSYGKALLQAQQSVKRLSGLVNQTILDGLSLLDHEEAARQRAARQLSLDLALGDMVQALDAADREAKSIAARWPELGQQTSPAPNAAPASSAPTESWKFLQQRDESGVATWQVTLHPTALIERVETSETESELIIKREQVGRVYSAMHSGEVSICPKADHPFTRRWRFKSPEATPDDWVESKQFDCETLYTTLGSRKAGAGIAREIRETLGVK